MRFTPKTEKEIQEESLTPPGTYDYEVLSALDKESKSGNDMIELRLRVYVGEKQKIIYDYLLEAMIYKMLHFSESNGLMHLYDTGNLTPADCVGQAGKLELIVQKGKGGFPDRNSVADYIVEDGRSKKPVEPVQAASLTKSAFDDDELPF